MFAKRAVVAALAASLAVPAATLAASKKDEERKRAEAKHEAELSQAQAQHEKGAPAPLNGEQQQAIGAVVDGNKLLGTAASMAAQRAKSPEVKNIGKWISQDEVGVSKDLGNLLKARGADPAKLPPTADRSRIEGELAALSKAPADAFDQQFVDFLTRYAPTYKEAAGRARDATPGSDADLKWYLDQVERLEIGHRDAARQLSSQRQARTPPQQQQQQRPSPRIPRLPGKF
jgi:predicted outer membrane protein